jgi:streptogramin lyase
MLVVPAVAQLSAIPLTQLKPDAVIELQLFRGALADEDGIWLPQPGTASVVRIDAKNNSADRPIAVGQAPCASLVKTGDELLTPTCAAESTQLVRVSIKHRNVSSSMPLPVAEPAGSVAVAGRSLWAITDRKGVVTRIDFANDTPVAEVYVAARPFAVAASDDAVWVTSEEGSVLTRIDPHTNVIVETIKVGPQPGPLAVGEGAVWTLNRGDGSISRVDAKTNKVVTTIKGDESFANAEIAAGEGAVWLSGPGVPLLRIDPRNNRVSHRFTGDGGGAIVVGHGSVWVSAAPAEIWRLDPKLITAMRP